MTSSTTKRRNSLQREGALKRSNQAANKRAAACSCLSSRIRAYLIPRLPWRIARLQLLSHNPDGENAVGSKSRRDSAHVPRSDEEKRASEAKKSRVKKVRSCAPRPTPGFIFTPPFFFSTLALPLSPSRAPPLLRLRCCSPSRKKENEQQLR